MNKKLLWIYLLSGSIYFTQGIEGLPGLSLFLFLKEHLNFTPEKIMFIASLTGLAWVIKPVFGFLIDNYLTKKSWIILSLIGSMIIALFMGINPLLTLPIIIIAGLIGNYFAASRDVACDAIMCTEGKETDNCSKIQAIQWISITVASILVGLGGGYIAQHYSYKIGYLCLIPIYLLIIGIVAKYKENPCTQGNYNDKCMSCFHWSDIARTCTKVNIVSNYKSVEQEYSVKDDIWKSRRWNKEHTDYIDLSGHSSMNLRRDKIYCIGKNAFVRQIYQNMLSYKELFTNKQFLLACLFLFLYKYSPSFGTPLTFIERDVFHWSAQWMGILGAIVSCFEIIGAIVFYKFCKKINIKKWLYLSVWLGACTTLSYLHFTPITAIIYGILYAIIGMGIHLIVMSWMAKSTLPGKEATSFALLCSVNNLSAGTLSSFTGAILYPLIGLQWLIILSAFTSFLCLPIIKKLEIK
jgi:ABC-type multidrug transport system fused ATPase/permease subunit